MTEPIVIVAARRTPIGAMNGQFVTLSAPQLASHAIKAIIEDSQVPINDISEVIMGCVLPAGLGQAPARQAALAAKLPTSIPCTTLNKVCGSGMKTVMLAFDQISAGSANIMIAGGMESMTTAPYLLPKARQGFRYGHTMMLDHMAYDGLENPYDGKSMGTFGELCAEKYGFTREAQDQYATESVMRAQMAVANGNFKNEIIGIPLKIKNSEESLIDIDETPSQCKPEKIPKLKPAFKSDGTVTAASSASISDGAAAIMIMRESDAKSRGIKPLARIWEHTSFAQAPEWFTTAPIKAIDLLHKKLNWTSDMVDLYEINEAFAVVAMAAMKDLNLPHSKVNVNGGACALGHPIGATGTRLIVTLLHSLRNRNLQRGIASLCIGGGEATAIAIETI